MKKTMLLLAGMVTTLTVGGAEPQIVFDVGGDNGLHVVKLADVSRLVMSPAVLRVESHSGDAGPEFSIAALRQVIFDHDGVYKPSAIEAAAIGDGQTLRVSPSPAADCISVSGLGDSAVDLSIFAVSGAKVANVPAYKGGKIDVSALPSGVYVIVADSLTAKFLKL